MANHGRNSHWAAAWKPSRAAGPVAMVVGLTLAGCGGQASSTAPSAQQPLPGSPTVTIEEIAPADVQAALPPDSFAEVIGMTPEDLAAANEFSTALPWQSVTVDGITQAIACTGTGGPTVVYLNGLLLPSMWTWPLVVQQQSTNARVCLIDRPGTGLAPGRPEGANSPVLNAAEALAALAAVNEPGPYLLTGWSYGGVIGRVIAATDPELTAGLVLVDSTEPDAWRTYDPDEWNEADIDLDMAAGEQAIVDGASLNPKPVVELVAGIGPAEGITSLDATKAISTNAVLATAVDTAHPIPQQNPPLVVAATDTALTSAREANAQMPPCPTVMVAAGAACILE